MGKFEVVKRSENEMIKLRSLTFLYFKVLLVKTITKYFLRTLAVHISEFDVEYKRL